MDKIQKYTFVIDEETQKYCRLDLVLSLQLKVSQLYTKAHRPGQVPVDGKSMPLKSTKVSLGEAIEITLPPPEGTEKPKRRIYPIEIYRGR